VFVDKFEKGSFVGVIWNSSNIESLEIEFSQKKQYLRSLYEGKIKGNSNLEAVRKLKGEYRKEVEVLTKEYQITAKGLGGEVKQKIASGSGVSFAASSISENKEIFSLNDKSKSHLNLDDLVYCNDLDMRQWFLGEENFMGFVSHLLEGNPEYNLTKELLKTSFHLTPQISPKIAGIGNLCKERLGLNCDIDFYVYQNQVFNAMVYPPKDGKVTILLTSGILENFNEDEICFVIGHELGHFIFDHYKFPASYILQNGADFVTPLHAVKLYSWSRSTELSADRIGLICCDNFAAAVTAFFKLSSGITKNKWELNINSYLSQFENLKNEMLKDDSDPKDWYTTHPFGPLRIKALELFLNSEPYYKIGGKGKQVHNKKQLETGIWEFMSLMEPDYLINDSEKSKLLQSFLFRGGMAIAAADGVVDQCELSALAKMVSGDIYREEMSKLGNPISVKSLFTSMSSDCDKVHLHANKFEKSNLLRDLVLIAISDGVLDVEEMKVLYEIGMMLGIRGEFIEQIVDTILGPRKRA
jgi:hypothetical protein